MKRDKLKTNMLYSKIFISLALFLFVILGVRVSYLALSIKIDGINLKEFASTFQNAEDIIESKRGSIYDSNGNILAQNISSYTVIAYLSEDRDNGDYVQNKERTAKLLAPLLTMTEVDILKLLNKDAYQVELGPGGRNISQSLKDQVKQLNLKGIDFVQSTKRYYPNGDYASYIIGYSKENEKNEETGEMGIEKYYNDSLTGTNGSTKYQADRVGNKIATAHEFIEEAKDGNDIYLTIDTNIQLFIEEAVKNIYETSTPEWVLITAVDAKTGAILGSSSSPSFDPNIRNITNYLNPLTSIAYEPGSTMKIFTYMAALETGKYVGTTTYHSGSITFGDDTVKDWNGYGWGTINYDQGFALSSNVGVSSMFERGLINKKILKEYYAKLGFGSKTNVTLPTEVVGKINFKYEIETANATFGQGITTTAIQNIQALTAVANNGVMLRPYIVEKIVDYNGNTVVQYNKQELGRVASEATITKIKELMKSVANGTPATCTGSRYHSAQYDIMVKTGTAQISDDIHGGYLTGYNDYIRGFAGIFPSSDPQVIIYAAVKKGANVSTTLPNNINSVVESIGKYLNINQDQTNSVENVSYKLPSYINKTTVNVAKDLQTHNINPIIIGSGTKIINQYPTSGTKVTYLDKVILLTNSTEIKLPSFIGWSRKDFITFANLTKLNYEIEGTGYVISQSIAAGTTIIDQAPIKIVLASATFE